MARAFEPAPEIARYADVPVHRRRWAYVLTMLFFIPAGVAISASGPVYALRKGEVVRYTKKQLTATAIAMLALMGYNLSRLFLG
jgi:hypothetical protein